MIPALWTLLVMVVPPPLEARLAEVARKSGFQVGIHVEHLGRQETASVGADRPFPMASTFKLPLAVVVLKLVEKGTLPGLDAKVRLQATDMIPWASPLHARMPEGGEATLREVLASLLEESDNSAADFLVRHAGGPARVQAELARLGLPGISIDRDEAQIALDVAGAALAPAERTAARLSAVLETVPVAQRRAAVRRFRADPRDRATPRAMARLLERLSHGKLLGAAHTDFLRQELARCRTGARRLRAGVPPGTAVASRTGTCGGAGEGSLCTNDVGVITLPSGDAVVVSVFVEDAGGATPPKEDVIAAVARAVWSHYAGEVR